MTSDVKSMMREANITVDFWTKPDTKEKQKLTITHLSLPFILCLIGLTVASTVFAMEMIFIMKVGKVVWRRKLRRRRRRRRRRVWQYGMYGHRRVAWVE